MPRGRLLRRAPNFGGVEGGTSAPAGLVRAPGDL